MNRRTALNNLAIAAGGLITLPQWMISCGVADKNTHASSFTAKEQELLAAITDTIIPPGNSVGALSVGTDKYLQKLLDDCYEQRERENFRQQLKRLNDLHREKTGKEFAGSSPGERLQTLSQLQNTTDKPLKEFFDLIKSETIRGFTTSQKVMQDYLGYKVAPGHYYGCVNINS
jgi:hypothetical protein